MLALFVSVMALSSCHSRDSRDYRDYRDPEAFAPTKLRGSHAQPVRVDTERSTLTDSALDDIDMAEPPPTAEGRLRERCPDDLLPGGSERGSRLSVRVRDARAERRDLLPLDLKLALESESGLRAIVIERSGTEGETVQDPAHRAERRYVAELLIDAFSGPRLFRRLQAPRSEWAAGNLRGRLVVRDLRERRTLCQVPISVRGDAAGAPIRRRLRESTRQSLEQKLYARAFAEMQVALGTISSVLTLARTSVVDHAQTSAVDHPETSVVDHAQTFATDGRSRG